MKLLRAFWEKIGTEKFVGRVATIGCTLATLFMVMTMPMPKAGMWAMGVINGFMILVQVDSEFEEE